MFSSFFVWNVFLSSQRIKNYKKLYVPIFPWFIIWYALHTMNLQKFDIATNYNVIGILQCFDLSSISCQYDNDISNLGFQHVLFQTWSAKVELCDHVICQ